MPEDKDNNTMRILAFSTSSEILSVCVTENGIVKALHHSKEEKKHSAVLMPAVDRVLEYAGMDIRMIDLFACDIGPGSYTGIRIATAAANAFLAASDKKVVGITSLDALCFALLPDENIISVMIHARNDQIYAALYFGGKLCFGYYAGAAGPYLDMLRSQYQDRRITFAGSGAGVFSDDITRRFENALFAKRSFDEVSARSIAMIANETGGGRDILIPVYLKPSSAKER